MRKKLIWMIPVFVCLSGGAYFLTRPNSVPLSSRDCAFCKKEVLDAQKFYENDLVYALYTHRPIMEGHCLVIPKRHVERFEMLSREEADQISEVIKKVNRAAEKVFGTSSYLLLQKNGVESGQVVPHVHFHYVPRKEGDTSALKFIFKMFIVNILPPMSHLELERFTEKMKEEMAL